MSAELKPCPFCGSKPVMRERSGDERNGYNTSLELDCKCGASIETETQNNGGLPTETVASAKRRLTHSWNTRAALTPPEGYVPESAVLGVATRLRRLASAASPLGRKAYIKAAEDIELTVSAARPEVP